MSRLRHCGRCGERPGPLEPCSCGCGLLLCAGCCDAHRLPEVEDSAVLQEAQRAVGRMQRIHHHLCGHAGPARDCDVPTCEAVAGQLAAREGLDDVRMIFRDLVRLHHHLHHGGTFDACRSDACVDARRTLTRIDAAPARRWALMGDVGCTWASGGDYAL